MACKRKKIWPWPLLRRCLFESVLRTDSDGKQSRRFWASNWVFALRLPCIMGVVVFCISAENLHKRRWQIEKHLFAFPAGAPGCQGCVIEADLKVLLGLSEGSKSANAVAGQGEISIIWRQERLLLNKICTSFRTHLQLVFNQNLNYSCSSSSSNPRALSA